MLEPSTLVYRKLWPSDLGQFKAHLLRLDRDARLMRFCGLASDEHIGSYCERINWLRTSIVGCFAKGELHGIAELVRLDDGWPASAELALTVEAPYQDQGIGSRLLEMILVIARNRMTSRLHMICLLDNTKMQHIARKFGAALVVQEGEVEGRIQPSWPSYLSLFEEAAAEGHAIFRATLDFPGWAWLDENKDTA